MVKLIAWVARKHNGATAEGVPTIDTTLLVASAATGLTPHNNSAGTWTTPPPPAMASIYPANKAIKNSSNISEGSSC